MSQTRTGVPWHERHTVRPPEIAKYTGISLTTIYDAIHEGHLPARRVGPKVILVRPADVDAWIERQDSLHREVSP